jgi:hypothetical protein
MSKISIEGNQLGSGTFTIASPNSNSNFTLTLPESTGTMVVTGGAQTIEFAAGTVSSPSITTTGDTNTGIFFPAADTIAFSEGGTEAMRIDSSGRVGIGTGSPIYNGFLSVAYSGAAALGGTIADNRSFAADVGGRIAYAGKYNTAGDYRPFGVIGARKENATDGNSAGYLQFSTNGNGADTTERMRIDSSGNVGIGTSSPDVFSRGYGTTFAVSNTGASGTSIAINSGSAVYPALELGRAGSRKALFTAQSTVTEFGNLEAVPLSFIVNSSERARFPSGGGFLVSTTIQEAGATVVAKGGCPFAAHNPSTSGNAAFVSFGTETSYVERGSITYNRAAGLTAYNTTSDYRLKENIVDLPNGLAAIAQLRPRQFDWKETGNTTTGFIAHELAEVLPHAVSGEKDATRIEQVEVSPAIPATFDDDGNELTPAIEAVMEDREVPVYQGVDTSFLVATLTAAIQELKAELDSAKEVNAALEARITAIENGA